MALEPGSGVQPAHTSAPSPPQQHSTSEHRGALHGSQSGRDHVEYEFRTRLRADCRLLRAAKKGEGEGNSKSRRSAGRRVKGARRLERCTRCVRPRHASLPVQLAACRPCPCIHRGRRPSRTVPSRPCRNRSPSTPRARAPALRQQRHEHQDHRPCRSPPRCPNRRSRPSKVPPQVASRRRRFCARPVRQDSEPCTVAPPRSCRLLRSPRR
jgi:hypothetical protein